MEERLTYIGGDLKRWLITLLNTNKADLYLLDYAKELPENGCFNIKLDGYWHENSPLKKPQGYLIIKEDNESEFVVNDWVEFFQEGIKSKDFTISGLVNFIILTDRIGSLPDAMLYELTGTVINAIPTQKRRAVLEIFINSFNRDYIFSHDFKSTDYKKVAEWVKLFRRTQYLAHFNNPIHLLVRVFKSFSTQVNVLDYLTKMYPDPRAALVQYEHKLIEISAKKMIPFIKKNEKEIAFYSALIVDKPKQKLVFFNKQFAKLIIQEHWSFVGNYFFQLIFTSTNKLNEAIEALLRVEITKLIEKEIYLDQDNIKVLTQFSWPEDYLALGGWLNQKERNENERELNQVFLNCLTNELAKQFKNTKNSIPEMLSRHNSHSKEKWLGDPFKINSQYIQVYLNWGFMNADEENWVRLKADYSSLCGEIKVLLYASHVGKQIGLKLANQLLILLLNFPVIKSAHIPGLNRLQELYSIFIKHVGLQWIFFSEQSKFIWNNKDQQPSFMDADLLFIVNILNSYPNPYESTVNPLLRLIKEHQLTEWPVRN